MSQAMRGACLCGEITFEVQPSEQFGAGRAMGMCHCTRCQRWTGGAGLPFVVVAPEHFRVTTGQELMAHYRREGSSLRTFCRRCGSSIYGESGMTYFVGAGVLRDVELKPAYHLHVAYKAAWDEIGGDAPQFPELPATPSSPATNEPTIGRSVMPASDEDREAVFSSDEQPQRRTDAQPKSKLEA